MIRPAYILCYVIVVALAAQLTIDLNLPNVSIPVSGQTLALLTGAVFLYPKESLIGMLLYWVIGIIGIPVFSNGNSGWEAFSGGSLGYFIGFLVAAVGVSYCAMKGWADAAFKLLVLQIAGTMVILSIGTLFLSFKFGLAKGIEYGFTPFILGGAVKIVLGVALVILIHKFKLLPSTTDQAPS